MTYAEITFQDKNLFKRYLQRKRLASAIKLSTHYCKDPKTIVDFGGGNGELCKILSAQYPKSKIICYEPTPYLLAEARENLKDLPSIELYSSISHIEDDSIDLLFTLEVFEHLPETETSNAINDISRLLTDKGLAVIGVPVEIFLPALYRGFFRLTRRAGSFDAKIDNILYSLMGFPPKNRPSREITDGFEYYFDHMGFDYRNLRRTLIKEFNLLKCSTSPFGMFTPLFEPEVNFMVSKR
jgi:SAM-dependent methyltransferase